MVAPNWWPLAQRVQGRTVTWPRPDRQTPCRAGAPGYRSPRHKPPGRIRSCPSCPTRGWQPPSRPACCQDHRRESPPGGTERVQKHVGAEPPWDVKFTRISILTDERRVLHQHRPRCQVSAPPTKGEFVGAVPFLGRLAEDQLGVVRSPTTNVSMNPSDLRQEVTSGLCPYPRPCCRGLLGRGVTSRGLDQARVPRVRHRAPPGFPRKRVISGQPHVKRSSLDSNEAEPRACDNPRPL